MVTGRDKDLRADLRALSCCLSKLQNEFDRLALSSKPHLDHAEVVKSELEIANRSVRKANATISESKVNESKGYLYKIRVTLIYIIFCLLTTEYIKRSKCHIVE